MRQRKRPSSLYRDLQDIDMVNVRMILKLAREIFFLLSLHACELWVYVRGEKPTWL